MTANPPRIVFFGMRCRFSAIVLETLVEQGCALTGVLLAGEPGETAAGDLPLTTRYVRPGTIEAIAKASCSRNSEALKVTSRMSD